MAPKFVTIFCYWGGKICDGQEGLTYDKPPSKAIKVEREIQFNELINKIHTATSIDKQQYHINLLCRYPSVVGISMKYIPLPINDNDDIEIMFDVLSLHQELSNIDLYLELENNRTKRRKEITQGTQESVLVEEERNDNVVSNFISSGLDTDNDAFEGDGDEIDNDIQDEDENSVVSHSESKNDLIQELGKKCFKDKEELIRAIKLYTIRKRRQYEVVETCPTIWKIRCKLCSQSSCKWQLRACKRQRSGFFEITRYTGPHTCLEYDNTQDHPNLDASLIAEEFRHLVKEKPSISIPALRVAIVGKFGYSASYKKVWVGKQKALEQIFGKLEESHVVLPIEGKTTNLCGICSQGGHNKKTCPSKPKADP